MIPAQAQGAEALFDAFATLPEIDLGAVVGALTLLLAGSFLTFLAVPPDWQIGAQGAILIAILALRLFLTRMEVRP